MNPKGYLSDQDFKEIYSKVPRLCLDLVIKNEKGIVLGLRANPPFENMWNLIGGTMYKGETVSEAAKRIARGETNLNVEIGGFLGFIEYLNEERSGVNFHNISIIVEARVAGGELRPDKNTKEIRFFKELPENLIKEQKIFLTTNITRA